jgi:hypothetical protein
MASAGYHCKKYGLGASSKCAKSRSVFTASTTENILSNVLAYDIQPVKGGADVTLILKGQETGPDSEMLQRMFDLVRGLTDEEVKHYCCGRHEWVLDSPTCGLGCCKKEE